MPVPPAVRIEKTLTSGQWGILSFLVSEVALFGTLIVMANNDQPGVIGDVGTALGRSGINIGSFALGRVEKGAVGVIAVDEAPGLEAAVREIEKVKAVKEAVVVRL